MEVQHQLAHDGILIMHFVHLLCTGSNDSSRRCCSIETQSFRATAPFSFGTKEADEMRTWRPCTLGLGSTAALWSLMDSHLIYNSDTVFCVAGPVKPRTASCALYMYRPLHLQFPPPPQCSMAIVKIKITYNKYYITPVQKLPCLFAAVSPLLLLHQRTTNQSIRKRSNKMREEKVHGAAIAYFCYSWQKAALPIAEKSVITEDLTA